MQQYSKSLARFRRVWPDIIEFGGLRKFLMLYYLNNWGNRDHARIYGGKAMYDLWAVGIEGKRAQQMRAGDQCLVLSGCGKVNVVLAWYSFIRAIRGPDDLQTKRGVWVLEGDFERQDVLSKLDAICHPEYKRFFNKLGHVCQWSVLRDA